MDAYLISNARKPLYNNSDTVNLSNNGQKIIVLENRRNAAKLQQTQPSGNHNNVDMSISDTSPTTTVPSNATEFTYIDSPKHGSSLSVKRTQSLKDNIVEKLANMFSQSKQYGTGTSYSTHISNRPGGTVEGNQNQGTTPSTGVVLKSGKSPYKMSLNEQQPFFGQTLSEGQIFKDIAIDVNVGIFGDYQDGVNNPNPDDVAADKLKVHVIHQRTPVSGKITRAPTLPTRMKEMTPDNRQYTGTPGPSTSVGNTTIPVFQDAPISNDNYYNNGSKVNRNRPGSLRQVLPDKKLVKEKAVSTDNLSNAKRELFQEVIAPPVGFANPVPESNPFLLHPSPPPPILIPKPPMGRKISAADSEENNSGECTGPPSASSIGNPARSSSLCGGIGNVIGGGIIKKTRANNVSPTDSGVSRRDVESSDDENMGFIDGCSDSEDVGGAKFVRTNRMKSGSLDGLTVVYLGGSSSGEHLQNPTVPQIRQPTARLSSRSSFNASGTGVGVGGTFTSSITSNSPPKSVTWNLTPQVVSFSRHGSSGKSAKVVQSGGMLVTEEEREYKWTNSTARNNSDESHHHHSSEHHRHRRVASDEKVIIDGKGTITHTTLIAIHESFVEQMALLLREGSQLLEDVKTGGISMNDYKEVVLKILNFKQQIVCQMSDILKQSEFTAL